MLCRLNDVRRHACQSRSSATSELEVQIPSRFLPRPLSLAQNRMNCCLGASDQNLFNSGLLLDQDWFVGSQDQSTSTKFQPVLVTVSMARFHFGTGEVHTIWVHFYWNSASSPSLH